MLTASTQVSRPGFTAGALQPDPALARTQQDFASVIARARSAPDKTPAQAARDAAEQFIASALVQPLLSQLRSGNNAAAPFQPTQGERQFQALADAQTALALVRRASWPIVDRIAQGIIRHADGAIA